MISWIVASHDPHVLQTNLLSTLPIDDGDELVVVRDAPSITVAYADGQQNATRPIRCYVHHDVRVLNLTRLREELITACAAAVVGMVGVVGCRDVRMPWWEGSSLGSVVDGRSGVVDFGGGGECSMLDGVLLATSQHVDWDTDWPGWHGYDHDACRQMIARGLTNWCLSGGRELVHHNTTGAARICDLVGWDEALTRYRDKWEVGGGAGRPVRDVR